MNTKRGRPESLLSKSKDAALEEIRNTIHYGTPAWRFIRLRELLKGQRGLQPNFLSAVGAAQIQEQIETHTRGVQGFKALSRLYNELRAEGKLPAWLRERDILLEQLRPNDTLPKQWIEAAHLWRELSQQIEHALIDRDADWLNELAKAIREEAKPEHGWQFDSKVLELYKPTEETTRYIFEELDQLGLVVISEDGKRSKVLDRVFYSSESKRLIPKIMDAIRKVIDRVERPSKKREANRNRRVSPRSSQTNLRQREDAR